MNSEIMEIGKCEIQVGVLTCTEVHEITSTVIYGLEN